MTAKVFGGFKAPSETCDPMSLAEANECCGQGAPEVVCKNCPLLIERREHPEVMVAARAM